MVKRIKEVGSKKRKNGVDEESQIPPTASTQVNSGHAQTAERVNRVQRRPKLRNGRRRGRKPPKK